MFGYICLPNIRLSEAYLFGNVYRCKGTLNNFYSSDHYFPTGNQYTVTSVTITNRSEYGSENAQNVRVGVTNTQPVSGNGIDPYSYTVCGDKDGKDHFTICETTMKKWSQNGSSLERFCPCNLVDGGGLRTFFCDPMHRLRSSGYSIPHTKPWVSAAVHTLAKKSCFSWLFGSHLPD